MKRKSKYIEDEADDDEYDESSEQSEDEDEDDSSSSEDDVVVPKKKKKSDGNTTTVPAKNTTVKVFSNKTLDASKVPPKPSKATAAKKATERPYVFRLIFTNGILLRKFLEPAANAVKKMRFEICRGGGTTSSSSNTSSNNSSSDDFTGFKIECQDQAGTLADRGIFECDVEASEGHEPHGQVFCVLAEAFMEALMSSTLKETDLRITKYADTEDKVIFESVNNENDVRTVYQCNLVDSSQVDSLDGISIELGFHVNVQMSTLKDLSLNAKRCKATSLRFDLWQAPDTSDPNVIHSKMCVGFQGLNTSGSTDFFISTKKEVQKGPDGNMQVIWSPLTTTPGIDLFEGLKMERRCSNEYDNKKLRLFLNHMECQWVLVHLCTDNTVMPLVLDCVLGGSRTKHTVIIAPKEPSN